MVNHLAMAGEEKVDFERITKVYREESSKKPLVSLEQDFYDLANEYLQKLEQEAANAASENPTGPKTQFLQDELRKAKKRIEQIYQYRERKIALLAQSSVSGVEIEIKGLTTQDSALLKDLITVLQNARKDVFKEVESPKKEVELPPMKKETTKEEIAEPSSTPSKPQRNIVTIYVAEDVPPFAGIDVTYNLKKEDVVSMPKEYGDVLVKRGKAKYVEMN